MKLRAIVSSDCLNHLSMTIDNIEQPGVELVDGSRLELANEGESGLSFNQGDYTVPTPLAEDGIDLPMTEGLPGFNARGALRDVALPCQAAPAVIGAVTLSALFDGTTEVDIQVAAGFLVGPDVQINTFVADTYEIFPLQISGSLLGTPFKPKKRFDQCIISGLELLIAS